MATTSYEHDGAGGKFIPATQRPDGTWRKPRRVKDGYIPQEEIPLYESKGKQFKARQNTGLPVGLPPELAEEIRKPKKGSGIIQPIPGMVVNIEKKKKKKKSAVNEVADRLSKVEIIEPTFNEAVHQPNTISASDPNKKLKNLRKKLRDIETLEEKINIGTLNPDKDQKDKISKKNEIIKAIEELEKCSF
ncbi:partner of Y14 and mago [Pieris napi]|uniref:partner of Y14 and mago n=1 Tax=Pieris napi TaxID=78633 RepID=UPI001FBA1673|nr:partner of Y14 and mago [Pieris napi]